jgi:hypothetical protein
VHSVSSSPSDRWSIGTFDTELGFCQFYYEYSGSAAGKQFYLGTGNFSQDSKYQTVFPWTSEDENPSKSFSAKLLPLLSSFPYWKRPQGFVTSPRGMGSRGIGAGCVAGVVALTLACSRSKENNDLENDRDQIRPLSYSRVVSRRNR